MLEKISGWSVGTKLAFATIAIPAYVYSLKAISTILLQDKLIYNGYFPPGSRAADCRPYKYNLENNFEESFVNSIDGTKLQLWKFKSLNRTSKVPPTLLYFQGNGGNLGHRMSHIKLLMEETDANIVSVHYRGYGRSKGWSTETGIQKDSETLLRFADGDKDLQRSKYFAFGHSLGILFQFNLVTGGGAVAIDLAHRFPTRFKGLVIENTFLSVKQVVNVIYPKWTMYPYLTRFLWNHWASEEYVKSLNIPILYIVGGKDEVIPPDHSETLFQLSKQAEILRLPDGMHDNTWKQAGYRAIISEFIK